MPIALTEQAHCRLQLDRPSVSRVLIHLLHHELTLLRPVAAIPPVREWSETTNLNDPLFGIDSLKRMKLASAVSEVFHVIEPMSEDLLLAAAPVSYWVDTVMASLAQFSARMSFRTSGSMGRPRQCVHDWKNFEQEIPAWAALLHDRKRIVSYVPPHHIYGFLHTVLLPLYMGIPVVDARMDRNFQLAEGDLIVSFPDRLGLLAISSQTLPPGLTAVSSTSPLSAATARALLAKGVETLLEMYGSSETGGLAYRFDNANPFTLLPYLALGDGGDLIRTALDGQVSTIEMPDIVTWLDARTFRVERRKDGAIQVSGINVYPQFIANRLAAHDLLSQAYVRPAIIREQQRLKAFLIFADPRVDTPKRRQELVEWIRMEFRVEERPVVLTFGNAPPRNHLGKLMDWPIDERHE